MILRESKVALFVWVILAALLAGFGAFLLGFWEWNTKIGLAAWACVGVGIAGVLVFVVRLALSSGSPLLLLGQDGVEFMRHGGERLRWDALDDAFIFMIGPLASVLCLVPKDPAALSDPLRRRITKLHGRQQLEIPLVGTHPDRRTLLTHLQRFLPTARLVRHKA